MMTRNAQTMKKHAIVFFSFAALFAALLGVTSAQALDADNGDPDILKELLPDDDTVGPVANVDTTYKFDDGFYQKVQNLILEEPQDGDHGVYDGARYYDVIVVVGRDDGDDREPDETARENKAAVVRHLEILGARNIAPALSLSFVTASIPVADIPGFSLHEEVFALGDGEMPITVAVDTARRTIHATSDDLRASIGRIPNGAGVTVAVVDTGINGTHINNKVIKETFCHDDMCEAQRGGAVVGRNDTHFRLYPTTQPTSSYFDPIFASHGTQVAQVLAASILPNNNGIASGVSLLDALMLVPHRSSAEWAHAIDWSYRNGADVINSSVVGGSCNTVPTTKDMIINEVVDKGVVVVQAAGNDGRHRVNGVLQPVYNSTLGPSCAHNVIAVGGVNDRGSGAMTMYTGSSRGPSTLDEPRMLPHIVAPAVDIRVLEYSTNATLVNASGTSYAAPQVSAVAAMMLQLEPELTPAEVKAALLLGANWTGPVPCTSSQYERNTPLDNCSYAMRPGTSNAANNAASLGILNNVGFGILDASESLRLVRSSTSYVVSDHLDSGTTSKQYRFTVTDTSEPVKVILVWLAHPHGGIIAQENRGNVTVPVADLDMMITPPSGAVINATSMYQSPEFAVFSPQARGTYTVTVSSSGLDALNKPVQTFALASTSPLTEVSTTSNRLPVAQQNSVIVGPGIGATIRISATDADGDAVSFRVSQDPAKGTVTTDELLTSTTSRIVYTPDADFAGSDRFRVTPHDGTASGYSAVITLRSESLPPGSSEVTPRSHDIRDWDSLVPTSGFERGSLSGTFTGPGTPVSALHVGSANMEGISMSISAAGGATYTVAVPESGTRMLEFSSPITIRSITLSADAMDDGAYNHTTGTPLGDMRVFAGYVPSSCAASGVGGQAGSSNSCPSQATYRAVTSPALTIPDDTDMLSASSTMNIPVNGTLESISVPVDITHKWRGDLRVVLTAPNGSEAVLHNRAGGSADHIRTTYTSSSHAGLAGLIGSHIVGNWTLSAGDYVRGLPGVLNTWSLDLTYRPSAPPESPPTKPTPSQTTVFSDDFESTTFTGSWTETGEGDWALSTSSAHSVPTAPGHASTNKVMHVDNCDTTCTLTLKNPLDLSGYDSATLSFLRFVDYGLDNGEYLKVELYNGASWKTVYHWTHGSGDDNRWHAESYDLSSYLVNGFKVRFVAHMSYYNEDVQLDDIVINATSGSGSAPSPPPTSAARSIYIADTDDREILAYSLDGTSEGTPVASRSAGLGKPWDVAFGPDGNMYVSDNTYSKIRKYDGSTGAPIGSGAIWASTGGYPYGLEWNGNTLYVATSSGIERFSSSGTSLGYFGDAHRNPSGSGAVRLLNAYDLEFCSDSRMYVADRSSNKILYYSSSTGSYLGSISGTASSTPDTYRAAGVTCGAAITGSGYSIYQSGADPGQVNEINTVTGALKTEFNSLIDEPYGIDMDSSGNLYVVNKDDDNVLRISPAGTTSVHITGGLDDPRGIAIGPRYSQSEGAAGSGSVPDAASNDSPEITIQRNGTVVTAPIEMRHNSTLHLDVLAADAENDTMTLGILRDTLPEGAISMTAPVTSPDGSIAATISINSAGLEYETYVFWIEVSDSGDNYDREPYAVRVMPN